MKLPPEEPSFEPWTAVSLQALLDSWQPRLPDSGARPGVIAVDGRGAGGKSTLAAQISRAVPGSVVVHTDDIAWHHAFFDWAELLRQGVLIPAHAGQEVHSRPPAWDARGREEAIEVPVDCPLLIVEGCGAARKELMPWMDVVVWVQSDLEGARTRGLVRDGGTAEAEAFWDEWMAEELPFFARERPWERAHTIACGMPELHHDPMSEVVIAAT